VKNLSRKPYFIKVLLILIVLGGNSLRGQSEVSFGSPKTAEEFVQQLRNSALLVRLQDKSVSISTLNEKGMQKEAEALAAEQRRENREILLSFSQIFDFCPVYFFYAKDSEAIRKGNLTGVVFNYNLEIVKIEIDKFFTAEFAETPDLGIDGLIVKNQNLLALDNDLPFFERRYVFLNLIERSKAEIVEAYNNKLYDYAPRQKSE
jgi:post-segregation antitoxin (ccd killing protein)